MMVHALTPALRRYRCRWISGGSVVQPYRKYSVPQRSLGLYWSYCSCCCDKFLTQATSGEGSFWSLVVVDAVQNGGEGKRASIALSVVVEV